MSTGEIGGGRDGGRDRCGKKIVLFSRIWS
jgi:hypothetical protein